MSYKELRLGDGQLLTWCICFPEDVKTHRCVLFLLGQSTHVLHDTGQTLPLHSELHPVGEYKRI